MNFSETSLEILVYGQYFFINFTSISVISFLSFQLPFQQYFLINFASISAIFFTNPASISAMCFHRSRFHFSNIFSPIPLPFQLDPLAGLGKFPAGLATILGSNSAKPQICGRRRLNKNPAG